MRASARSVLALAVFMASHVALALDAVTEQYAVSAAMEAKEKAKSQYEVDVAQVKEYRQRIAEEQKQLAVAERKAAASKARYAEAKANYAKKQAAVERAWKK